MSTRFWWRIPGVPFDESTSTLQSLPYGPRVLMTVHGIEPVHRCNHYFIPDIAGVLADLNQQLAALPSRIYPKAFVKTG